MQTGKPQNILITGISGGIGRACAKKLLDSGSGVIGISRDISGSAEEFSSYGKLFRAYSCDLTDMPELENTLKTVIKDCGPAGGFIHCAGFDRMAPLYMARTDDIEALWRIHALAPMRIISILSKRKNHCAGAPVVLITSQSAHEGAMGHTAYAAAKGAIEGYLPPAAAELMEKDMRINLACFGPVRTGMAEGWMEKLTQEGRDALLKSYPLGIGGPDDASSVICFLMSPEARFINGQIITADGGHSVRKV